MSKYRTNLLTWRGAPALLMILLLLAAALGPAGSASDAGGKANNSAPTIESFTAEHEPQDEGRDGLLLGTVRDRNGESDIIKLKIALGDAPGGITNFASEADLDPLPATKPGSFTDGWKVWDGTAKDGIIHYEFRYSYPADVTGTFGWELEVEDEGGPDAQDLDVVVVKRITISDDQVLGDGTSATGAAWGNWTAQPGAVDVSSTNYLKIQNTGTEPQQQFVLDFSTAAGLLEKSFVGVTDGSWQVPIEGNIQFAYWEGDATSVPADGTFTYLATSTDAAHTFAFSDVEKVIFITYRLPALPGVLAEQDYGASFTITPL